MNLKNMTDEELIEMANTLDVNASLKYFDELNKRRKARKHLEELRVYLRSQNNNNQDNIG